jgi:predicted phage-related endonuclease
LAERSDIQRDVEELKNKFRGLEMKVQKSVKEAVTEVKKELLAEFIQNQSK